MDGMSPSTDIVAVILIFTHSYLSNNANMQMNTETEAFIERKHNDVEMESLNNEMMIQSECKYF